MKIKCDVCEKEEASVFCSADEAALCQACDRRVHHANKLATKHQRLSLFHPSSNNDYPLCDICQDKRALLFCKEDRALLCRECDVPIHKANLHTQNHNRFLLTGIKISLSTSPSTVVGDSCPSDNRIKKEIGKNNSSNYNNSSSRSDETVTTTPNNHYSSTTSLYDLESTSNPCSVVDSHRSIQQEGSVSTSSISEYLMETLPGWHVEDFLDPPPPSYNSPYGFCKIRDSQSACSSCTVDGESNSGNFYVQDFAERDTYFHQNDVINNGSERSVGLKESIKVSRKQKRDYIRAPPWISTSFF